MAGRAVQRDSPDDEPGVRAGCAFSRTVAPPTHHFIEIDETHSGELFDRENTSIHQKHAFLGDLRVRVRQEYTELENTQNIHTLTVFEMDTHHTQI